MAKHGKKYTQAREKLQITKPFSFVDGIQQVKGLAFAKFDESVDVNVNVGIDPSKGDQVVRGSVVLPHSQAIVRSWGLFYAAREGVFQNAIKGLGSRNDTSANPQSDRRSKAFLTFLKDFGLEVGSEGLMSIQSVPQHGTRTTKAADTYRVNLPCESKSQGSTIDALAAFGAVTLNYLEKNRIDPRIAPFLDYPLEDSKLIGELNSRLEKEIDNQICAKTIRDFVFPDVPFWKKWKKFVEFITPSGGYSRSLFDALERGVRLNSVVHFVRGKKKEPCADKLGAIISMCSPFEYQNSFYIYRSGIWIKVEESRLSSIQRFLRQSRILQPNELFTLYPYTELDEGSGKADRENGSGQRLFPETEYNKRIVAEWNSSSRPRGSRAILLDCLSILLKGSYHKFEFADIVMHDDTKHWKLIHVKRRTSNDIDHHRQQVERTVEYLTGEHMKKNGKGLFFEAFLKALCTTHKVSSLKSQRSTTFVEASQRSQGQSLSWKDRLSSVLDKRPDDGEGTNDLKDILSKLDVRFFDSYQEEYFKLIDVLRDCNKKRRLSLKEVEEAFLSAQQAIELNQGLFEAATKKESRKKITLVMAVIDNREVARNVAKKQNASTRNTPLFPLQDLWGIDQTRRLVEKKGFTFVLTVVNKQADTKTQDVFGEIKPQNADGLEDEMPDIKRASKRKVTASPKKTVRAKRRRARDESDDNLVATLSDDASADTGTSTQRIIQDEKSSTVSQRISASSEAFSQKSSTRRASRYFIDEDAKFALYQYSSTDIANLLHVFLRGRVDKDFIPFSIRGLSSGEVGDSEAMVYKSGTRYVLPPVYSDDISKDPEIACVEVLKDFFSQVPQNEEISNIIIPFNCEKLLNTRTFGHWYTIRLIFPPKTDASEQQKVFVNYYDSLRSSPVRHLSKIIHYLRHERNLDCRSYSSPVEAIKQSDGVSCGPITVEHIGGLFRGYSPTKAVISKEDGISYKKAHQNELKKWHLKFDHDDD
jgi:hypothetical protein